MLVDDREQVLDPMTAYQMTSMLEGVVQRGTGDRASRRSASRSPARPARPTTTRTPGSSGSRPTSRSASTSATTSRSRSARARPAALLAAPIFRDFMQVALDRQAGDAVPHARRASSSSRSTARPGMRVAGRPRRRSSRPSSPARHRRQSIRSSAIDRRHAAAGRRSVSPDADRAVRCGTGGLY